MLGKSAYVLLRVSGFILKYISADISEYRLFKSPNICIDIGLKKSFIGQALIPTLPMLCNLQIETCRLHRFSQMMYRFERILLSNCMENVRIDGPPTRFGLSPESLQCRAPAPNITLQS